MKTQGFEYYQTGRLPEAHHAFSQACSLNPADAESWMMLGVVTARLGGLPQAIAHLQRATQISPNFAPAWSNLGLALLNANHLQDAETCLRRATELAPNDAGNFNTLGTLYRQTGQIDAAIRAYEHAIRLQPRNADAYSNLGAILQSLCRTEESIAAYRKALKLSPRFAQAEFNLGSALQSNGEHEQAVYHFRKALELDPGLANALAAIASVREQQGRIDDAIDVIAPLIKGADTPAPVAIAYATIARRKRDTAAAADLLTAVSNRADIAPVERQAIEYALGDLYDQQGEYEQAFAHYQRANQLRPYTFDVSANEQRMRRIMDAFPSGSIPHAANQMQHEPALFIVGMPRSSTSLVEQILASHPSVHGGGELPYISQLLAQTAQQKGVTAADAYLRLDSQELRAIGQRYVKAVRGLNPKARFVTDKMPHNFLHLGLIAQALPGVRIAHCMRNPLDTCLSIYFHNFNANHPYATDLRSLGHYYLHYEMLMAHWREVLGEQMLDVSYETLLADQEGMTRRLLEHCGLDWSDGCLAFHANKRIVTTPSYDQVRRPLYTSSRERWRNYEKHLGPLMDVLDGRAP